MSELPAPGAAGPPAAPPAASVRPARRASAWIWWIPPAAAALALWLGMRALEERGPQIRVRFEEGHGIKAGDPLRHLGITVGEIAAVELTSELDAVRCSIVLDRGAAGLARAGTRFWIVRPHVSLDGVGGLETIVGARYVAADPGPADAEEQNEFIGLEAPPLLERVAGGGLEIVLHAPRRFGLLPGAPLYYRQIQVGSVISVALSTDATAVEVHAYVRPVYVPLVRANSRFWQVTGIDMRLALTEGFSFELESLRTLISGGVALATPNDPGPPVATGHVFLLRESYEDEWLEWRPAIPIGSPLVPEGVALPEPARAVLRWRSGRFLKTDEALEGNVLAVAEGLVGPSDLFARPGDEVEATARLEVAGEQLALDWTPLWERGGVACVAHVLADRAAWPAERMRRAQAPEDCLVVADGLAVQALSAARFGVSEQGWEVEKRLTFEPRWHGAPVVARSDGALVGVLLLARGRATVVPLAE